MAFRHNAALGFRVMCTAVTYTRLPFRLLSLVSRVLIPRCPEINPVLDIRSFGGGGGGGGPSSKPVFDIRILPCVTKRNVFWASVHSVTRAINSDVFLLLFQVVIICCRTRRSSNHVSVFEMADSESRISECGIVFTSDMCALKVCWKLYFWFGNRKQACCYLSLTAEKGSFNHRLWMWRWFLSGVRELHDNFKPRLAFQHWSKDLFWKNKLKKHLSLISTLLYIYYLIELNVIKPMVVFM